MSRKELWSDHPAERFDTKTREIWIDLDRSDGLIVGLRVDVAIDVSQMSSAALTGGTGVGVMRENPALSMANYGQKRPQIALKPLL